MKNRHVGAGILLCSSLLAASPAAAAVPHLVQPGESLSSVAAANGYSATTLASWNGLAADAYLIAGETIQVPSAEEVGVVAAPAETAAIATAPAGMGYIDSPWGQLALDPAAAESWNAMADAAMTQLGVTLHPAGPVSAYRTYEQQAALYDQFLAGTGAPANPPGTSSHELGISVDVPTHEMRSAIDQIGAQYGWYGTIPAEWWHVAYGG